MIVLVPFASTFIRSLSKGSTFVNILGDVQDVLHQTAKQLQLDLEHVTQAAKLLQEGATLPFIAAYRKEVTGNMTMEQLHHLDRTKSGEDGRSEIYREIR